MKFVPIYSILAAANGSTWLSKISEIGRDLHKHLLMPMSEFANLYGGGIGHDDPNEIPSVAGTAHAPDEERIAHRNVLAQDVGLVGVHTPHNAEGISAVLADWERRGGRYLAAGGDNTFKDALAIMWYLIRRYPSIPGAELPKLVGFPLFCSASNFASTIRFENNIELGHIRSAMYERSDSVDPLVGLAEWGSICPDLINDSTTIALRGLILIYRAIRAIPDLCKAVHITVRGVGAFHDSLSLLLGPVAVLLEGGFWVTTETSAGYSQEIHDWFVAVNNDLGSSPVIDKALGRFLALCLFYKEPILWQLPLELAEALVGSNGQLEPDSVASLVEGFQDLIPRDMLLDITGEELISIIHGFGNKDPVVPFLGSVPDADLSSLGLFMLNANLQVESIEEEVLGYLKTSPELENPLERWTRAGGPELLRLSYSQSTHRTLRPLMILFADSGANAEETGLSAFCETHQYELEKLLFASVLNERKIRAVLFSSPKDRRAAVAEHCFAADWFTQFPSVLGSSSYLKGIALSHMVVRDIVQRSDSDLFTDAIIQSMKNDYLKRDDTRNFVGRRIGLQIVDRNARMPQFTLSAFEDALSGSGPVAAEFATVIPPTSIARFASLGITPGVLKEIVAFYPARIYGESQTETPNELMAVRTSVAFLYDSERFEKALWVACNLLLKAVGPIEDAELSIISSTIGLNKVCINLPGYCRSAFGSFESAGSTESIDMVVQKLASLFPEFWTANRVDLTAVLIRARHNHTVKRAIPARQGIERIEVHRDSVLIDSWKWLSEGPAGSHWRLSSVSFVSELGTGPGVFADWFALLASELGKKVLTLRTELPQYYVPNPTASPAEIVALGRLLGLALVFEKPIPLGLPLMLFAGLLPGYTDYSAALAKDDPTMFASYQRILGMDENVVNDEIEINSVVVTDSNREQLIKDATRGPFQGIVMENILNGFSDIVPPHAFAHTGIASPIELQLLIQGASDVDIGDMRAHVGQYVGYTSNDDQMVWLFSFLEASDLETRRRFLHFVTGLNAVGVGGFLTNPINIQYISGEDTRLPSSHTCTRMLDLPKYSSRAILEEKLTIAINADSAMGTN